MAMLSRGLSGLRPPASLRLAFGRAQRSTLAAVPDLRPRARDEDPYSLLLRPSLPPPPSDERASDAAGLAWKLLHAKSAAKRWVKLDPHLVRSHRYPGVFFVDIDLETARAIGAQDCSVAHEALRGPDPDFVPRDGMVRLWTYRLFLNAWAGKKRQTVLLPSFGRWWFGSELEAAFVRDYRLFRDCLDLHAAWGIPPPRTRPCLPAHRVGREQSPFSGVGAVPGAAGRRWRYSETWGDHRRTRSYVTRRPGGGEAIATAVEAAGRRELSYRRAVVRGDMPVTRAGEKKQGGTKRIAKTAYCNFAPHAWLPGEGEAEHEAWVGVLQDGGWGRPSGAHAAGAQGGPLADDRRGWSAWRASVLDELRAQAEASMLVQGELDRAWEASGMPHPVDTAQEGIEVLSPPARAPLVTMVLSDDVAEPQAGAGARA